MASAQERKSTRAAASAVGQNPIDAYLATVPAAQRGALEDLRRAILGAAPEASEVTAYSMPAFRIDGRLVVGFMAKPRHCGFYLMSSTVLDAFASELKGFTLGKGTIQFSPERPIPAGLVRRLVLARIAENDRGRGY